MGSVVMRLQRVFKVGCCGIFILFLSERQLTIASNGLNSGSDPWSTIAEFPILYVLTG
jgi:hypothetical protein